MALEKDWTSVGKQEEVHESEHSVEKSQNLGVMMSVHSVEKVKTQKGQITIYLLVNLAHSLGVYVCMSLFLTHTALSLPLSLPPSLPLPLCKIV